VSALDFLANVADWVVSVSEAHPWLAPLLVLLGGILSIISPCSLASLPLMMGYILSQGKKTWKKNLLMSLAFVVGLSLVFTGIGIVAVVAKSAAVKIFVVTRLAVYGSYVVGMVLVVVGAWFMGLIHIPLPEVNLAGFKRGGMLGAFLLGIAFAFTTGPCSGPILAGVVTLVKGRLAYQALLVFLYSVGAGASVMIAGLFAGLLEQAGSSERFSRFNTVLKWVGGALFIVIGFYFLLSYRTWAGMILAVVAAVLVTLWVVIPRVIHKEDSVSKEP